MAPNQKIPQENLNPQAIAEFRRLYNEAIKYAQQEAIPIHTVEGACRDTIASIEGVRLLISMRNHGARL